MQQANIPDSSDPIHLQLPVPVISSRWQYFPCNSVWLQTAAHLKNTGHVLTLIYTYFNLLGSNHYKFP